MEQLRQELIEREARRTSLGRPEPTRYTDALNRYLTAQGYAANPGRTTHPVPERSHEVQEDRQIQPVVVVGVDGSPGSYVAVDHAVIEAELRGWEIKLVHVQHAALVRRTLSEQRNRGAALLHEMGERIRRRMPDLPVATSLRVGRPGDILVEESADAGLIVVGNRGYSTVVGLLSPSLSLFLTGHAAGPLLVVRVPAWPPGQGWSERPVLVGVDGSAGSAAALRFGLVEARLRGTQLLAMHATRVPLLTGTVSDPLTQGPLADSAEWIEGVRVRRRTIDEDPIEGLIKACVHASAVVVGARGHGEPGHMLPGAVGRSLVQRAHCPVFVVQPPVVHPASETS